MNCITIMKKTTSLLLKIKNPYLFIYSVFHYLKRDVPYFLANRIQIANSNSYNSIENELLIHTYDGSNQSVHPDSAFFDNKKWLIATPYPYGMEEYENPSLFYIDNNSTTIATSNPIATQRKHAIGFHLSDPCIFEYKNKLMCVYRENIREQGEVHNILWLMFMNKDGIWSDSKKIIESVDDALLSPALYVEKYNADEELNMIHVKKYENDSVLVHSVIDRNMSLKPSSIIECEGIPTGYYIWHIAIANNDGLKIRAKSERLLGLFLLRSKYRKSEFKLYYAELKDDDHWKIKQEVLVPDEIKKIEFHPYKSCFLPKSNDIIYSYIDKKRRYRMTIINGNIDSIV